MASVHILLKRDVLSAKLYAVVQTLFLQAQQQAQWAACQKWHAANQLDQWGNPVGTEYPGGSPCRPGSNSTVFAEARLAKLRGLDRPDWLVCLLFNRVLHPTQPWRIPPFMVRVRCAKQTKRSIARPLLCLAIALEARFAGNVLIVDVPLCVYVGGRI